jgi:hypothetical protein
MGISVGELIAEGTMPPIIIWTLGALGAAVLVKFAINEARRINAELDEVKGARVAETADGNGFPTLRRDPGSGEYRVQ